MTNHVGFQIRQMTNDKTRWPLFLLIAVLMIAGAIPVFRARAQNPNSGTVGPSPGGPSATWQGTATAPGGGVNTEAACVDGVNCEVFTLTVASTQAAWAGQRVRVQLNWQSSANEYDIYIHQGSSTSGPLVASAMNGPGLTSQTAFIDVAKKGTGIFTIHVVYDTTPLVTDHYTGNATAVSLTPPPPPPAGQDTRPKIGYQNFEAPGVLTNVNLTTGPTVEYMGRGAGEPSIGNNWNTGVTNFQSDLETLFITFNDSCPSNGQPATWVNRPAPTSQAIDSDPIGFTDRQTGRTFAGELTLLTPTCKVSYTDSDGLPTVTSPTGWSATSGPLGSAVDHETIGGGPYHRGIGGTTPPHSPTYPNAVYYCSQDIASAFCLRSDDGGDNFGPAVPIYSLLQCGGLHGHVKVSADGIVYVPNNDCSGEGAAVVSEDNGITWNVRLVRNSMFETTSGNSDPAIGIDNNGRVYFAIANADSAPVVATSDDRGNTWNNIVDVGATYGLKNIRYPAAVAADAGRAAVAFYGTTTPGDANSGSFDGIWHLYVAHTFDGGESWTTSDATPNAPVQRGCIWTNGGANVCRNLLDFFDMTVDREGRVLVGYVNGCEGGNCAQSVSTAKGNAWSPVATIARQSSGRRLVAAYDPPSPTVAPGMPSLTQRRVGTVVHLGWSEADTGNSPITSYQILRGTSSGSETLFATVTGTQTNYDDTTASDTTKTYYYEVVAVNAVGASCKDNEVAAPYVGDYCKGLIIHKNDPTHPESVTAQNPANAQLAIDYVAVGEPPFANGTNNLMFKMKVSNLTPAPLPDRRWRIVWDAAPGQSFVQYYAGMTTDSNGAVSFEYGRLADAGVPAVLVLSETRIGAALPQSNFNTDGTITIYVPKSGVGNPEPGDLLGPVGGRTFADSSTTERSTTLIDHTFVKGIADNSYPAATYTVAGTPPPTSYALATLGAVASASTTYPFFSFPPSSVIDGDRTGNTWGNGGGWNDGTYLSWPDSLTVDLNGNRSISEIRVYTLQNNWTTAGEPNSATDATGEGILDFDVQTWNGSAWVTIPGGSVTNNTKAMRVFTLGTPITTSQIRVVVNNGRNGYSRIVEVEAACNCHAIP